MLKLNNSHGMALTMVLVVTTCLLIVSGAALQMSADFNRAQKEVTIDSIRKYYLARGGIVDAQYRITNNMISGITEQFDMDFSDPEFDPDPYLLDLGGVIVSPAPAPDPLNPPDPLPGPNTVVVDISTDDGTGRRITARTYS